VPAAGWLRAGGTGVCGRRTAAQSYLFCKPRKELLLKGLVGVSEVAPSTH